MMEKIIDRFLEYPLSFALAIAIICIATAHFFKVVGEPIMYLIEVLKNVFHYGLKELRGRAGNTGIVNLVIVLATSFIAFLILIKPTIKDALSSDPESTSNAFALMVFLVAAVVFLISLRNVHHLEKTNEFFMKIKDKDETKE